MAAGWLTRPANGGRCSPHAWLERLPADIRTILRERAHATWGDRLVEYVSWLFPAGGEWMTERIRVYTRDAELLGITSDHVPSTPGTALLTRGETEAAAAMAALFPTEVEQVYLQHDLTAVAPGPLAPPVDARLRTMADVEGRALASTYRLSAGSLSRAMAAGQTEASIREFLSAIALTGIPQPLDYLLTEASARFGLVRVGSTSDGRSYVASSDTTLLRTLLVDQSIGTLGLSRSADRLESRFDHALVFWSLSEARYPVAAENAAGEIVTLARRQATPTGCCRGIRHDGRRHRAAAARQFGRPGCHRQGLARAPTRCRHQGQGRPHRDGADARRNRRELPARAGECRRRTPARPRPQERHRTHACR